MNRALIVTFALIFSISFTGKQPSHAQASHKIKVFVSVDCKDENTKNLMQSWIKRELRSLGDVVIETGNDASYILKVLAIESEWQGAGKTGNMAVAVNFLQVCRAPHPITCFFEPKLLVFSFGTEDLERMCKVIVAEFDTQTLDPERIAREVADEILRETYSK